MSHKRVLGLPVTTKLDIDPNRVLGGAIGHVKSVVVIGLDKDGEPYYASSDADAGKALWLVEQFKLDLLRRTDPVD